MHLGIPYKKPPLDMKSEMCLPSVYYIVELSFGVRLKHKPFCRTLFRPNLFRTLFLTRIATQPNSNLFANWPLCSRLVWTPQMLGVIKETSTLSLPVLCKAVVVNSFLGTSKLLKSHLVTRTNKEKSKNLHWQNLMSRGGGYKGFLKVDMSTGRWIHVRWMDS